MATTKAGKAAGAAKPGAKAPSKVDRRKKVPWHITRTKAWAKWCRFEAEEALNRTSRLVLPAGKTLDSIRLRLLERVKNRLIDDTLADGEGLSRELPPLPPPPPLPKALMDMAAKMAMPASTGPADRMKVTREGMNSLLKSKAGTAWHKYERGEVGAPDAATVVEMDGWIPGSKAFYDVGPHGVPIWSLMGGDLTIDDVWLPVLHYREGPTDQHRRTADILGLDTLLVGNRPDADGRPAVPPAIAAKPVVQRSAADWRVIDEARSATLRIGARILSEYTPEQWGHALQAGYSIDLLDAEKPEKPDEKTGAPEASTKPAPASPNGKAGPKPKPAIKGPDKPGASAAAYAAQVENQAAAPTGEARDRTEQERGAPEEDGFMVGDVLLIALAALIHSGAKSTGEYAWNHPETDWLEDDVFIELQQRRRLFEMYGELGFFRDDMKAWLDALWAGYLDRNGYDTEPTVAEINAKRAEYARVVEEENAESAAIRPSEELRRQAFARSKKPSTARIK